MNKKIKLLRVVTQAEVVPWHLNNFIERSENDYELYITGNGVSKYKDDYPQVTFIDNMILRKVSFYSDLKALIKLIKICRKIKPQIIHSIMPKSGLLSSIAGVIAFVPIRIHTYTGQVWSTKKGIPRYIYKKLDKLVYLLNTICLTDSPSQSKFLADHGFKKKGNQIHCLGKGSLTGVNFNKFNLSELENNNDLKKELGILDNDFVYVFLARKSIVKGIIELFDSFDKISYLQNIKLLFIGPDESDGHLKELEIKYIHLSTKIINLGIVKNHEKYLAISDVLCLPSSSEGFGSVVIEAAALGIPTIGFDIVGLSDSIEHGVSGILVPFKNTDEFSKAMLLLYENNEKFNEYKLNASKRVLNYFSADVIYKLQDEFYKSLLKKD